MRSISRDEVATLEAENAELKVLLEEAEKENQELRDLLYSPRFAEGWTHRRGPTEKTPRVDGVHFETD